MKKGKNKMKLNTATFLEEVKLMFPGPVIALVRWSRAGGGTDYIRFEALGDMIDFVEMAPPETNILVFVENPAPVVEGTWDKIVEYIKASEKQNSEWLLVDLEAKPVWSHLSKEVTKSDDFISAQELIFPTIPYNSAHLSSSEVLDEVEDLRDHRVAIYSPVPDWESHDFIETFINDRVGAY